MAKHIIALIDGTKVNAAYRSNHRSYSNIFELASLLQVRDRTDQGEPQIVLFRSGISSHPDSRHIYDLVTGNSIMSQIVDQYTNICANYDFEAKTGTDKIYLFGFSRGAMAVRALGSIISEFGLLKPRDIHFLPELLYAWENGDGQSSLRNDISLQNVDIEFVGIFDAVMGGIESLPAFNPIRFTDHKLPAYCKRGIHIIAIDEDRPHFKGKLWTGVKDGPRKNGRPFPSSTIRSKAFRQIWMPGIHSDIGGTGNTFLGNVALISMIYFIRRLTVLAFNEETIQDREYRVRFGIGEQKYRISGNFAEIPYRRPLITDLALNQFHHPICKAIDVCKYMTFRKHFPWRERVFEKRVRDTFPLDSILESYFRAVCR